MFTRKELEYWKGYKRNVDVVGTPIFNNSIISGFSSSNYCNLPATFNPGSSTWEIGAKFSLNDLADNNLFSKHINTYYGFDIGVTSNKLFLTVSPTGTSTTIVLQSNTDLSTNIMYWIKAEFTGNKYNLYLSRDGVSYDNVASFATTETIVNDSNNPTHLGIAQYGGNYQNQFDGVVDLSECYVKIDGEYWWRGVERTNDNPDYSVLSDSSYYDYTKLIDKYYAITRSSYQYYKYQPWTQPVLSSNGVMGGDSFAVSASSEQSGREAYMAFNGNAEQLNGWSSGTTTESWISFYNPTPLKVSKLSIRQDIGQPFILKIEASNNNSSWDSILNTDYPATSVPQVDDFVLSQNIKPYKYFMIYLKPNAEYVVPQISEITIEAQETIESTSDDYDYREGVTNRYVITRKGYKYYKYQPFTQPILSSDGIMGGTRFACTGNAYSSSDSSDTSPYKAFDGNPSTRWQTSTTTCFFEFYNPNALKVSSLGVKNKASSQYPYAILSGNVYGSKNGVDYEFLTEFTNTVGGSSGTWSIDIPEEKQAAYNYYKIEGLTHNSDGYAIAELTITAQEAIENTSDDYDFFEPFNKYY